MSLRRAMTIPLIILAVLSIIGGFVGVPQVLAHGVFRLISITGWNPLPDPSTEKQPRTLPITGISD